MSGLLPMRAGPFLSAIDTKHRFVVAAISMSAALVATTQALAALSEADRKFVARVESYLNGIRTLEARFIQSEKNGWIAEGSLYISRPGRLRIEYAPPHRFLVVSTGRLLILYNGKSDQVTHLPTSASPASFLLESRIDFTRNVRVSRVVRKRDTVALTVRPRSGGRTTLRLVFQRQPFEIKEWTVVDRNRKETRIILIDKRIGAPIPKTKFLFAKPSRSARRSNRPARPDKVTEIPLPQR